MDKKEIVAKLTKMRQQYILNRSKKREEKKFVEETSQPLLSFRRKGNKLIVSGNSYSVRKINEAGPILEYLEEILLLNEAPEEGSWYVCQGEENNEEIRRGGGWQDLLSSIEKTVFAVSALPPF